MRPQFCNESPPSWAFGHIAEKYAELGFPLKALAAASNVGSDNSDVRDFVTGNPHTQREVAAMRIAYPCSQVDRPFLEDDGKEVFEAIVELQSFEKRNLNLNPESFVSKFAELGQWEKAEQAFELIKAEYSTPPDVPDEICRRLAATQDLDMLRQWCERAGKRKSSLLVRFGREMMLTNEPAKLQTVENVRKLIGEDDDFRKLVPFFVTGFWANESRENALSILNSADLKTQGQGVATDIVRWALSHNEPELAFEVIPRITNRPFELSAYSRYAALTNASEEGSSILDVWLPTQSNSIQAAAKLGLANHVLGVRFDLRTEFPRH